MKTIRVRLKERSYNILIGRHLLNSCGRLIKPLKIGRDAVVITNRHLVKLYYTSIEKSLKDNGFTVHYELAPDSEKAKSITVAASIINRISAYDKNREIFIIALGGGVIGDLTGLVAALYKRGVPYIQIPTTLLAQVDSAIGGKVAVDLPIAKNLVGAFYQPRVVISDVVVLRTLPLRQLRSSLAEVIKYGVIKDKGLFAFLEKNYKKILKGDERLLEYIVAKSSGIKAATVSKDEFDKKGVRIILNYGHTFGHAIEAASGYSGKYNHGEAIAIGMIIASHIAYELGLMDIKDAVRIEELIRSVGLPTRITGLGFSKVYGSHLRDKKFIHKKNRFVLPVGIGRVKIVEDVSEDVIRPVLEEHFLDKPH